MAVPLYHLWLKDGQSDHYYRTLTAMYLDKGPLLNVSLSTLQKHDFTTTPEFDNYQCTIRTGEMLNSGDVKERKKKMKTANGRKRVEY